MDFLATVGGHSPNAAARPKRPPAANRQVIPNSQVTQGAAMTIMSQSARLFCEQARVAHLATADARGVPHLVPVCFAIIDDLLYITIDEKPKRTDIPLKRLRNIAENPEIAVTIDRWDEDWRRLAWVMLRGRAEILTDGEGHDRAQARLRERYPQYRTMDLAPLPVIAMRIARASAWGNLDA
jgi:PPOX class probable F420-dependent enzyme